MAKRNKKKKKWADFWQKKITLVPIEIVQQWREKGVIQIVSNNFDKQHKIECQSCGSKKQNHVYYLDGYFCPRCVAEAVIDKHVVNLPMEA